eukprot:1160616-Pelagomonas_calceolata.AAC.5
MPFATCHVICLLSGIKIKTGTLFPLECNLAADSAGIKQRGSQFLPSRRVDILVGMYLCQLSYCSHPLLYHRPALENASNKP